MFSSVIVTHPADRTVFLNDDAVFTCLTDIDYTAHWRLNGIDHDDLPIQLQHDLIITYESTDLFGVFSLTLPRVQAHVNTARALIEQA